MKNNENKKQVYFENHINGNKLANALFVFVSFPKGKAPSFPKKEFAPFIENIEKERKAVSAFRLALNTNATESKQATAKTAVYDLEKLSLTMIGKVNGYSIIPPKAIESQNTSLFVDSLQALEKWEKVDKVAELSSARDDYKQAGKTLSTLKKEKAKKADIEKAEKEKADKKAIVDKLEKTFGNCQSQKGNKNENAYLAEMLYNYGLLVYNQAIKTAESIANERKQRNATDKQEKKEKAKESNKPTSIAKTFTENANATANRQKTAKARKAKAEKATESTQTANPAESVKA